MNANYSYTTSVLTETLSTIEDEELGYINRNYEAWNTDYTEIRRICTKVGMKVHTYLKEVAPDVKSKGIVSYRQGEWKIKSSVFNQIAPAKRGYITKLINEASILIESLIDSRDSLILASHTN